MITTLNYLGPSGTFSEVAARAIRNDMRFQNVSLAPANGIAATAEAASREDSASVLPYYNLLEGVVQESLDGIARNNLTVFSLSRLPIVFHAGCLGNTNAIKSISSHPKALGQCSEYIAKNFPDASVVPTGSTAAAAEAAAKDESILAIASETAIANAGLNVCSKDAGNRRYGQKNFTDFLLVSCTENGLSRLSDMQSNALLLVAPELDEPGLLSGVLSNIAWQGLNVTKLHSRPSPVESHAAKGQPQAFFMEISCNPSDDRLTRAVEAISGRFSSNPSSTVRVLGGFGIHPVTGA